MNQKTWILVITLLALFVLAVFYLDFRYNFLLPSPKIPTDDIAPPMSCFRLQIQTALLRDYLIQHYLQKTKIPTWVFDRLLPYQIGLFLDPDPTTAEIRLVLFLNDQRLGPLFKDYFNKENIHIRIPDVIWTSPGMVRERRGVLLLEGKIQIPPKHIEVMRDVWGIINPQPRLPFKNEHALEAVLDLRDGRGFLVLADWISKRTDPNSQLHPDQVVPLAKNVATIWISADLEANETALVQINVECRPEASESDAASIAFLMNYLRAQLNSGLQQTLQIQVEGSAETEGIRVVGQYRVQPLENLLRALRLL